MGLKVVHLVPYLPPPEFVRKDIQYCKKIANIDSYVLWGGKSGSWKAFLLSILRMIYISLQLLRIRPDVIHCHFMATTIPAAFSPYPSVVTMHESHNWWPLYWLIPFRIATRQCNIIYISKHNRQYWKPFLGKDGVIIYHAVDTEEYNPEYYREELRSSILRELEVNHFTFSMGPLVPQRGFHIAIKACAILRRQGIEIGFLLRGYGGSPSYKKYLRTLADELDVPFRLIEERLSDTEVKERYASCDFFVRPGIAEGFGIAVLEAQACGTPVVVTDCCSLNEVFQGSSLIFDPLDEISLAEQMKRILTDHSTRENLVKAGLRNARNLTWRKKVQHYLETYRMAMRDERIDSPYVYMKQE